MVRRERGGRDGGGPTVIGPLRLVERGSDQERQGPDDAYDYDGDDDLLHGVSFLYGFVSSDRTNLGFGFMLANRNHDNEIPGKYMVFAATP
jgi:hypothetical protein